MGFAVVYGSKLAACRLRLNEQAPETEKAAYEAAFE